MELTRQMDDTDMLEEMKCTASCRVHHLPPSVSGHVAVSGTVPEPVTDVTAPHSLTLTLHSLFFC